MKKLILLLCLSIYLFACKDKDSKSKSAIRDSAQNCPCLDSAKFMSINPMHKDSAKKYIGNFKNHKHTSDTAWTSFDPYELSLLVSQPNVDSVKFFLGAYGKDYLDPKKRDHPVIILQLTMNASFTGTTYLYYAGTGSCPPPDPPFSCKCEPL